MLRRGFIAGAVLAPVSTAAASALAADQGLGARCVAAIRARLAAIPPGPALLQSYLVKPGSQADFDVTQANAAYVYDNALAGLALLAGGFRAEAARIGDALEIAQTHDRFWHDGRLRNAYRAGPMTTPAKLPGWWDKKANIWAEDPYQAGSETGPVAWAMLLWTALGQTAPARRAGDWINRELRARSGYYGGFYGFEPKPQKLTWKSTEQNTDLAAAYGRLNSGDAAHAAGFVHQMFDPKAGRFDAGTGPAGNRNTLLAADAGIWPYLAGLGSARSALAAIAGLKHGAGIGFSAASTGIWPEGTAFAALALRRDGDPRAKDFLATVQGQLSPSGYVYASVSDRLATGLDVGPPPPGRKPQPFAYFRRPALSPTAWAALSALNVNPLST